MYYQYWASISFLKRFRRSHVDELEKQVLLETLEKLGHSTVNQLPAYLFKDQKNVLKAIHQVWALVSKKQIVCDLYSPLTAEAVIWVNDKSATKGAI